MVCKPAKAAGQTGPRPEPEQTMVELPWLMQRRYREFHFRYLPGSGCLPPRRLEDNCLNRAMRGISRRGNRGFLGGYGDPQGFAPLLEDVGSRLADLGIDAVPGQILLTNGVAGAIDLARGCLLKPGDVPLVDDPGNPRKFE